MKSAIFSDFTWCFSNKSKEEQNVLRQLSSLPIEIALQIITDADDRNTLNIICYFMTVSSVVNDFWEAFIGKNRTNSVNLIAQRFIKVFEDHDVAASQIPRLLPQIKLNDLKSVKALLPVLNHELLNHTAQLFGIRIQWLEGVDDQIYEYHSCYKAPNVFFEDFASICHRKDGSLYFPARAFAARKDLDNTNPQQQLLALVLVEKIAILDDKEIFRYHIYNDEWDWGYAAARIQIKAMVHLISKVIKVPVPLYIIKQDEMESLFDGAIIPKRLIGNCLISDPSLEDFAITNEYVGKEMGELPEVLKYIEEHQLRSLITAEQGKYNQSTTEPEASSAPSESASNAPKPGKRVRNNQVLWEPVRDFALTLWSKDNSLTIAEVIRLIKQTPDLQASGYTPSAIRKRIFDLAPEHIRGKPGRKPKKFT